MKKDTKNKKEDFAIHHKILFPIVAIILTIIISRIMTSLVDPNFFLFGSEIHHFYYGIILLIMNSFLMLYKKLSFKKASIMLGISIGLIADELIFISEKVRGTTTYPSTLLPTVIIVIIIILLTEIIYHLKSKKK